MTPSIADLDEHPSRHVWMRPPQGIEQTEQPPHTCVDPAVEDGPPTRETRACSSPGSTRRRRWCSTPAFPVAEPVAERVQPTASTRPERLGAHASLAHCDRPDSAVRAPQRAFGFAQTQPPDSRRSRDCSRRWLSEKPRRVLVHQLVVGRHHQNDPADWDSRSNLT
jgi:hypothetical protein